MRISAYYILTIKMPIISIKSKKFNKMSPFFLFVICLSLVASVSTHVAFEIKDLSFRDGRCDRKNPCPSNLIECTQFDSNRVVCSKPTPPG